MAVVSMPGDYQLRLAEANAAARILGCELRVLIEGGRRIDDVKPYQLVAMLDEQVRELAPAAVISHSAHEFHGDHVAVHAATLAAQRVRFFDSFAYHPTMTRPLPVAFHPRAYVDISESIDEKIAAIRAHSSQFEARGIDPEMFRDIARMQGRLVGVQHAEGLDVTRMLLA